MRLAQLCNRRAVCSLRGRTILLLVTMHMAAVVTMLLGTYPMYCRWGDSEALWLVVGDRDDVDFLTNANAVTGVLCIVVSIIALIVDGIGMAVLLIYEPFTHPRRTAQHYACLAEHVILALWNLCMCGVRGSVAAKASVHDDAYTSQLSVDAAALLVLQADVTHLSLALCAVQHAALMLLNIAIVVAIAIPIFGGEGEPPPPAGSTDAQTPGSKDSEPALHPGRPKLTALGPDTVSYDPPSRERQPSKAASAAMPPAVVPSAEPTQGRSDEQDLAYPTAETPATTPTPRVGNRDDDDLFDLNLNSSDMFGVSIPPVQPKSAHMDVTAEESLRKGKPHGTVEVNAPVPVKPPPPVIGAKPPQPPSKSTGAGGSSQPAPPPALKQPAKVVQAPAAPAAAKKAEQARTVPPPAADKKTAGGKKSPFWKSKAKN